MNQISSRYLIIATSGLIETGTQSILHHFYNNHCSPEVKKYISSKLKFEKSVNYDNIRDLLGTFKKERAQLFESKIIEEQRNAINRIKAIRNQIAHGEHNGTGYVDVKKFYIYSQEVLGILSSIVDGR